MIEILSQIIEGFLGSFGSYLFVVIVACIFFFGVLVALDIPALHAFLLVGTPGVLAVVFSSFFIPYLNAVVLLFLAIVATTAIISLFNR